MVSVNIAFLAIFHVCEKYDYVIQKIFIVFIQNNTSL